MRMYTMDASIRASIRLIMKLMKKATHAMYKTLFPSKGWFLNDS